MSMTLTIPDRIAQAAEELANRAGASAEQLLLKALEAHFPAVSPELQNEFDAWERASEEDATRVEQSVEAK